ncbi:hypothetical protein [Hahella sp. CR1]|uniref:hypothetical protein n=1 Tax=unclassified Hahella TaxID=2624107 RepID=UPI00244249F5|nr:hypothetical protein [Hahella sp. CR1]MDG9666933.1 hypothetical protein [Hahella sp. CR1]
MTDKTKNETPNKPAYVPRFKPTPENIKKVADAFERARKDAEKNGHKWTMIVY